MEKEKRKPTSSTQRITRKKTSAPRAARKGPLAEEAVAEIIAAPAPAPMAEAPTPRRPVPVEMPPVILIEARKTANEDEPTTRVVFRARPVETVQPMGWRLVRVFLGRVRSELTTRSAPVRARFWRRFPRLAGLRNVLFQ